MVVIAFELSPQIQSQRQVLPIMMVSRLVSDCKQTDPSRLAVRAGLVAAQSVRSSISVKNHRNLRNVDSQDGDSSNPLRR